MPLSSPHPFSRLCPPSLDWVGGAFPAPFAAARGYDNSGKSAGVPYVHALPATEANHRQLSSSLAHERALCLSPAGTSAHGESTSSSADVARARHQRSAIERSQLRARFVAVDASLIPTDFISPRVAPPAGVSARLLRRPATSWQTCGTTRTASRAARLRHAGARPAAALHPFRAPATRAGGARSSQHLRPLSAWGYTNHVHAWLSRSVRAGW